MNDEKLRDEMRKAKITISGMCNVLGISRSAFYRKCKGKSEFTLPEVQKIVDVLKLDSPMEIFFASKVSQKTPAKEA